MNKDNRRDADIIVDLLDPAVDRWQLTSEQCRQGIELLRLYKMDLGVGPDLGEFVAFSARDVIHSEHWQEMEGLGRSVGVPMRDVILCNLYYDSLKLILGRMFGCTAFAVETPNGILHARNLDWWTENGALSRYTATSQFVGAAVGEFTTVGWPGFIGVFSGIAPGRFAVSLNAVLSDEPGQIATPVTLLLRTVLEEAKSFNQALSILSSTALPSDCLLLLTGVGAGEMVVIERTPTRCELRFGQGGFVCVTNGYQGLKAGVGASRSELLATCCERLERVESLIAESLPQSPDECFRYLSDPGVRMNMTVQQMVFCAATGEYWLRIPDAPELSASGRVRLDV